MFKKIKSYIYKHISYYCKWRAHIDLKRAYKHLDENDFLKSIQIFGKACKWNDRFEKTYFMYRDLGEA